MLTFFLITVVGMETTVDNFRSVAKTPKALLGGILGQYVLPLIAILLLKWIDLKPEISTGLLIIACAPAGGISNVYTYLAKANIELSVTLTAVSCIAAAITTPLMLKICESNGSLPGLGFRIPLGVLLIHLILLLMVPVTLGLFIRHRSPSFVERYKEALKACSFIGLFLLIAFVISQAPQTFVQNVQDVAVAAISFIVLSMLFALLLGMALRLPNKDRFTLISELGVRNVAISTTLAVSVLSRTEFAVFGTAYFLIEMPLLLFAVFAFRKMTSEIPEETPSLRS